MAGANRKRKRNKKCKPPGAPSKGLRRHTKHRLGVVERVLLGKGLYQSFRPLGTRDATR